MGKTLEKGQDKIQAICDVLKEETIAPAKKEAEDIIKEAEHHKEQIIKEAHEKADELIRAAHVKIEQERSVFRSALEQGAKQALESLRQSIENDLFRPELSDFIAKETKDEKVIAKLVESMVQAIEKEGIKADLAALIPQKVDPKAVNALLSEKVLKRLEGKSVQLGEFAGGAEVKVKGKQLTLVMTDSVLKGLLAQFLRKDFREVIFAV